jgi:hypothetical protein
MRKILVPILLALTLMMISPAHANRTLFYDDFVSSGFPSQWAEAIPGSLNSLTQQGGYLAVTAQRTVLSSTISSLEGVLGNASIENSPIGPSTVDGQFIVMNWKMQPFNLTAEPSAIFRTGEVLFGFSTFPPANGIIPAYSIYFDLWISDRPGGIGVLGSGDPIPGKVKSAILLSILMPGADRCFDDPGAVLIEQGGSCQSAPQYSSPAGFIDLNAPHVFTMEMKLYPVSHTSWVAYKVDGMAWINMTQQACSCIDQTAPGSSYLAMYPFIEIGYIGSGGGCCISNLPTQSLATQIDYVLVTDYILSSLPSGQILSSNINPPKTNPQPYVPGSGGSLTAYIQYMANAIGGGNIYAGGMLLTMIVSVTVFVLFGLAVMSRLNIGEAMFGFLYSLIALAIAFIAFYAGVVPVWLPAVELIVVAGIMFGVITTRSRGGGSSGNGGVSEI